MTSGVGYTLWAFLLLGSTSFAQKVDVLILRADSAYENRRFAESARLYEAAIKAGVRRTIILYNAARSFALAGNKDKALRFLDQAVTGGWRNVERMKQDSDFVSIRSDSRWHAVLRNAETAKEMHDHVDALMNQLNHVAGLVHQYRLQSKLDGGGGGSYAGYELPPTLMSTLEGTFSAKVISGSSVELTASSVLGRGMITAKVGASGKLSSWTFEGQLKKLLDK
ncbi:MAG: tetratricopeptide repeat protein [Ignavibacteriales bacterium]|nr:tetratricopeptide repeat protein [Ignavibacteriales bacterium]